MMPFKRLCLLAFLVPLTGAFPLFSQVGKADGSRILFSPLLINESHRSAISALAVDNTAGLLASAAEDGNIKIYRDKGRRLIQSLQAGLFPVIKLALGPASQLAAVERQPGGLYRLSVWNYQTGQALYTVVLQDQVLFLSFSPRGNYLVCTLARWNSTVFLDLQNGNFRDWLADGFGLVDFALMSGKEDRLMSYQATSGNLVYHDLASGTELKRLSTKPRLQGLQLLPDGTKTRAVALDNGLPVSIDLISGVVTTGKSPGFPLTQLLTDDLAPSHLVAIGGSSGNLRLVAYTIDSNGQLSPGATDKSAARLAGSSACLLGGLVCLGDPAGQLVVVDAGDKRTNLTETRTTPIKSVAFSAQGIYLGTANGTFKVSTDLIQPKPTPTVTLSRFDQNSLAVIPASAGMYTLNDHEILFWDSGRNPKLNRLDSRKDQVVKTSAAGTGTILNLDVQNDQVSVVDSLGNVRISNLAELKQIAQFSAQGAFAAALTTDGKLLVGQGSNGSTSSPLQRITIKTGETVPINAKASALFELLYAPAAARLFSLAMNTVDGKTITALQQGTVDGQAETIASLPGEDLGADMVISADGKRLYTSLGGFAVGVLDGPVFSQFGASTHAPRKLSLFQNCLATINLDGSVTLYDAERRTALLDVWISTAGTVFYLAGDGTVGFAGRLQGSKVLPADSKDQQAILNALHLPESASDSNPGAFLPAVAKLPRALN